MCTGEDFFKTVASVLKLDKMENADSTLLNEYVIRVYFDDCIHPGTIDEFKNKIAHCCNIELYNCHIMDIIKKEPFIYL